MEDETLLEVIEEVVEETTLAVEQYIVVCDPEVLEKLDNIGQVLALVREDIELIIILIVIMVLVSILMIAWKVGKLFVRIINDTIYKNIF